MSRGLTKEINARRKTICVDGVDTDELVLVTEEMEALGVDCQPVLEHSYCAKIGRTPDGKGEWGKSYRRIFWFPPDVFVDAELAMRTAFLSWAKTVRKTRVTYKGFALDYDGCPLVPF